MGGRRQRTSPLDTALARLADLAGRGVPPSRIAREVEVMMAGWVGGVEAVDPDEVSERLATMHEQLTAGASAAAEQVGEIDVDDAGALRHATLVHAALVAAVEAVERARGTQAPAVPAPTATALTTASTTAPTVMKAQVMPPATEAPRPIAAAAAGVAVTIDPLAARNPEGVSHSYPAELRGGGEAKTISVAPMASKAKAAEKKKRTPPRRENKNLPPLLR